MNKIYFSILFLSLILVNLCFGPKIYNPFEVWNALWGLGDLETVEIIQKYRLTRTLIAIATGAVLAVSGLMLQNVTRNGLASPSMMGMNAGGALFVALGVGVFHFEAIALISVFAMVGAFLTGGGVFLMTLILQRSQNESILVLVGATVSLSLYGFVQMFMIADEVNLQVALVWLFGSFNNRSLELFGYNMLILVPTLIAIWSVSRHMMGLSLSDAMAKGVGVNTSQVRGVAFLLASILAGLAISMAGAVSFIGLLTPHLARRIYQNIEFQKIAIPTALMGALLALFADIASRAVVYPAELPVGILISFVGVPFLIYILYQRQL